MNCPKCQLKMPFQERICRRCQYCADVGDYVRTDAPRARRQPIQRKRLRTILRDKLVPQSVIKHELPGPLILAASIVPGLGHALIGRLYEGLAFLFVIAGLVAFALLSGLDTWTSLTMLGVGFGLHIASIIRVTTIARGFGAHIRASAHVLLFLLLSALIYSPLTRQLMMLKPQTTLVPGGYVGREGARPRVPADVLTGFPTRFESTRLETIFGTLVFAGFIFLCAWVLGLLLSFLFSLPEKRKS